MTAAGGLVEAPDDRTRVPRGGRATLWLLLAGVNVPIVVATVSGLLRGYQPLSDDGILVVRAADVGTAHHPLLGSGTSASVLLGTPLNNPGPLYFDAVAPFVKVLGPWVGLAVGVMIMNMAASSLAVVAARRHGGVPMMAAVALVVAGLQWAMGSELLYDVWQPNALVLPAMAFLVVVAALAAGDLAMAPWAVGVGSLLVQTHVSHLPLVAGLTVLAVAAAGRRVSRSDDRRAWRRPALVSAGVAAVAWSQPLVEQLFGSGEGNLSRIAGAGASSDAPALGAGRSVRIVAEVLVGPWFRRGSYEDAVPLTPVDRPVAGLLGLGPAVVVLIAVLAVLVVVGLRARRAGQAPMAAAAGIATAAVAIGLVGLAVTPVNPVAISAHQMRWLWPIMAFVTATLVAAASGSSRARAVGGRAVTALLAMVLVVSIANLPRYRSDAPGPVSMAAHLDTAQDLVADLGRLRGRGEVFIDVTTLEFLEPYSGLVFAELQDQGVPFVFEDEFYVRQFGEGRRADGSERLRMWQVEGPDAREVPDGAERVGYAEGERGPVALYVEPV